MHFSLLPFVLQPSFFSLVKSSICSTPIIFICIFQFYHLFYTHLFFFSQIYHSFNTHYFHMHFSLLPFILHSSFFSVKSTIRLQPAVFFFSQIYRLFNTPM